MPATRPKTKIVCTLGPSTASAETVEAMVRAGMSVARLNMSHGTEDEHARSIQHVRGASERLGVPVGIMVDAPGAKYRTGPLREGAVTLQAGDSLTLTTRDIVGSREAVTVTPPGIHRDAAVGRPVLLDDGRIELSVDGVNRLDVACTVVRGGRLTERRGVATPGKAPTQVFPDAAAMRAIEFAAEHQVDLLALSTIVSPADVEVARAIVDRDGHELHIVSKIERKEAIDRFDEILAVSDAVMVARGDMGVEVELAKVPLIQKDLIARSNDSGKPVITATQMLESMVESPVPTRAEVTDVANAVFDGTDAIMLSGETSVGRYPVDAVRVMAEVADEAEAELPYEQMIVEKRRHLVPQTDDAISYNACQTAQQIGASLIVAFTESGSTAGRVSRYRPKSPILALTPGDAVLRRLTLRWGVTPMTIPHIETVDDFFAIGERVAKEKAGLERGSLVVLVAGLPIGVKGGTNLLRVLTVT